MKISEKMAYLVSSVQSVSRHHDSDAAVRLAAMNAVKGLCDEEIEAINAEVAADIAAEGLGA